MDAHVAARLAKLDEVLKQIRAEYTNTERLRADVASLLRGCHTLQPRSGIFSNGGRSVELFFLYGVLPITYKGGEYNVPVTIYFDQPYPKQAPRCFVTPTPGMALKAGHQHVDEGGMIHVPYLTVWKDKSSTLNELISIVTSAFSSAPPVYSTAAPGKPAGSVATAGGGDHLHPPAAGEGRGRASRGSSPQPHTRSQSSGFARARRDGLIHTTADMLRERWPVLMEPVVAELNDALEQQVRLRANQLDGLGDGVSELDSQQALDSLAEELALDELLVTLDDLLAAHKITLEDFLRETREVSRRQFICRAQRLKSAALAAAAAPAPEAADSVRQLPMGGQQALRATGSLGLADRSGGARRL